jgi:hypothetical protein
MVYCFYSKDPLEKVEAYVKGPGKPGGTVVAFVGRSDVVDEHNTVVISDVARVMYYVNARPAAANAQSAAPTTAPPATADSAASGSSAPQGPADPTRAQPTQAPEQDAQDGESDTTRKAIETGKKLKGLLGI